MIIHINSKDRFIAELTKQDMDYYCLDYNSIDIQNSQTRELVSDLLIVSELRLKIAKPLSRLNIDIFSQNDGSILVIITLVQKKYFKLNNRLCDGNKAIVTVTDINSLLALLTMLSKLDEKPHMKLYSNGKNYAVEITKSCLDNNSLKALCLEFGNIVESDNMLCAQIKEHYSLICENVKPLLSF